MKFKTYFIFLISLIEKKINLTARNQQFPISKLNKSIILPLNLEKHTNPEDTFLDIQTLNSPLLALPSSSISSHRPSSLSSSPHPSFYFSPLLFSPPHPLHSQPGQGTSLTSKEGHHSKQSRDR